MKRLKKYVISARKETEKIWTAPIEFFTVFALDEYHAIDVFCQIYRAQWDPIHCLLWPLKNQGISIPYVRRTLNEEDVTLDPADDLSMFESANKRF